MWCCDIFRDTTFLEGRRAWNPLRNESEFSLTYCEKVIKMLIGLWHDICRGYEDRRVLSKSVKMVIFKILNAVIVFSNVFLQLLGCYLLWKTYNWTTITTQQLIIFNLSLCECLECCYWSIYYLLLFTGYQRISKPIGYFFCVHLGSIAVLYMLMIALTLDRLMNIVIGMRYSAY